MMIAFRCTMLNGTTETVYAFRFIKLDGDAAIFDIGTDSDYIKFGVASVK